MIRTDYKIRLATVALISMFAFTAQGVQKAPVECRKTTIVDISEIALQHHTSWHAHDDHLCSCQNTAERFTLERAKTYLPNALKKKASSDSLQPMYHGQF